MGTKWTLQILLLKPNPNSKTNLNPNPSNPNRYSRSVAYRQFDIYRRAMRRRCWAKVMEQTDRETDGSSHCLVRPRREGILDWRIHSVGVCRFRWRTWSRTWLRWKSFVSRSFDSELWLAPVLLAPSTRYVTNKARQLYQNISICYFCFRWKR